MPRRSEQVACLTPDLDDVHVECVYCMPRHVLRLVTSESDVAMVPLVICRSRDASGGNSDSLAWIAGVVIAALLLIAALAGLVYYWRQCYGVKGQQVQFLPHGLVDYGTSSGNNIVTQESIPHGHCLTGQTNSKFVDEPDSDNYTYIDDVNSIVELEVKENVEPETDKLDLRHLSDQYLTISDVTSQPIAV